MNTLMPKKTNELLEQLKEAKATLEQVKASATILHTDQQSLLDTATSQIDTASKMTEKLVLEKWWQKKSSTFDIINTAFTFLPTVIAACLIIWVFRRIPEKNAEISSLKAVSVHKDSIIHYTDNWIYQVYKTTDSTYRSNNFQNYTNTSGFSMFLERFHVMLKVFDSTRTVVYQIPAESIKNIDFLGFKIIR